MTGTKMIVAVLASTAVAGVLACGSEPPPPVDIVEAAPEPSAAAEPKHEQRRQREPAYVRRSTVEPDNRPPVVRSLTIAEDDEGVWHAEFVTDDPDGDDVDVTVAWIVNGEAAAKGEVSFDPRSSNRGDRFHAEATPHDGQTAGATAASRMVEIANAAPSITSTPPAQMYDGVYRYVVEASDTEGDAPLRYELATSPAGMQIDAHSGELTWRPDANQAGEHDVEIVVRDSRGAESMQSFVLPIVPPPASMDN